MLMPNRPTKEAALYTFWSGFTIPAYEENTIPDEATLPYITYQVVTDNFLDEVQMSASIWYRSDSWVACNAKAKEVATELYNGVLLECEDGLLWLKQGTPFAQNMTDDSDRTIKRKYLNVTAEYLTTY